MGAAAPRITDFLRLQQTPGLNTRQDSEFSEVQQVGWSSASSPLQTWESSSENNSQAILHRAATAAHQFITNKDLLKFWTFIDYSSVECSFGMCVEMSMYCPVCSNPHRAQVEKLWSNAAALERRVSCTWVILDSCFPAPPKNLLAVTVSCQARRTQGTSVEEMRRLNCIFWEGIPLSNKILKVQ